MQRHTGLKPGKPMAAISAKKLAAMKAAGLHPSSTLTNRGTLGAKSSAGNGLPESLRRTSTLKPGGQLRQVSEKKTATAEAAGKRVAPSLKTTYTGPSPAVCKLVDARADDRCEFPTCWAPWDDRHHRLNRKAGGRHGEMRERLNSAAWLICLCRHHHDYVTSAKGKKLAAAKAAGWVLVEGQDAERRPVLTSHSQMWVVLDNRGGITQIDESEIAADGTYSPVVVEAVA
jgi:hypothetical protein